MQDFNLITVQDFTDYAPEISTSQYTGITVSGIISQASKIVTDYLQYNPIQESVVGELKEARITSEGDLLIFPNKPPVQSVSKISIKKGSTSVDINLTDGSGNAKYNIDFTKRNIRFPAGELTLQGTPIFTTFYALRGSQFYTEIDYVGGWLQSDLPASITSAVILVTREIFARTQNTSGATRISQGGVSLEYSQKGESDFLIDARRLLNPYKRIG